VSAHSYESNLAGVRPSGVATVALSVAAVSGVLLVVAGFFAPMYRWTSESTARELAHGSETLVGVNGPGVAVVLGVPLLATVLVGATLWLRARRRAIGFAWTVTGLLTVFNLLAMASIGLFVVPVTAALLVACAASGRRRTPSPVT
jgi:hypothetical protein